MGSRKTFVVNGETFATKKALQDRVRSILWSYKDGDMVNMFDAPFLFDLFKMHPSAEQKIGCGIAHAELRVVSPLGNLSYAKRAASHAVQP